MDRTRHGRFQRSDGAERRGKLRLRARRVEFRAAAGIESNLRELERGLLVRDVAARDVELQLLAAQLEVGARDFAGDDHLHVLQRGFLGAELGLAGFEPAAHAAEEVEFPERVEAGVVELSIARGAGQDALVRRARLGVAAAGIDARREIEGGIAPQRACFLHARQRDAQVVVRRQRVGHEFIEFRVGEVVPERSGALPGGVGGFHVVEFLRGLRFRRVVVRAHGAGGQHGRGDGR